VAVCVCVSAIREEVGSCMLKNIYVAYVIYVPILQGFIFKCLCSQSFDR
jgi:hypothetical protein